MLQRHRQKAESNFLQRAGGAHTSGSLQEAILPLLPWHSSRVVATDAKLAKLMRGAT